MRSPPLRSYPPVPAQLFSALHPTSGDARSNTTLSQRPSASFVIVSLIRMKLERSTPARSPAVVLAGRLDSINHINHVSKSVKSVAVMDISSSADYGEWYPFGFDHKMALRARFAFIRWRWAGTFAPFLAAILAESTAARDQSILPASPNLSSNSWCNRSHTPASCQSLSLRQQVMPLPQPISGGRYSQGKPVLSTKMMPVNAARLGTLGRPPIGLGGSAGNSGSITFHNSSLNICFAIP